MTKIDERGVFFKQYEDTSTIRKGYSIIRIDGKNFHAFTKGLKRPFDISLQQTMGETIRSVMNLFPFLHSAYTQSDEVSFLLGDKDPPYNGRVQKIITVVVSSFTAIFSQQRAEHMPSFKRDTIATFDGRIFTLENKEQASAYFEWREIDAVRNAVSMAARCYFSDKELHKKTRTEMIAMMKEKGIIFDNYPLHFRKGMYYTKKVVEYEYTLEEIEDLPPYHHARTEKGMTYKRTMIEMCRDIYERDEGLLWDQS